MSAIAVDVAQVKVVQNEARSQFPYSSVAERSHGRPEFLFSPFCFSPKFLFSPFEKCKVFVSGVKVVLFGICTLKTRVWCSKSL